MRMQIHNSNCLDVMRGMDANSIDAIVTDPPYGLRFMGKKWDYDVPSLDVWKEALRVAKPGAHLLCFGGSRTYHRMTCAIEDAGWEIRDCIMWVYGSGFPKSMDVSKAIDKKMGAERETTPATPEAAKWNGYGTSLKPAFEPIIMARKPLDGTVADNVLMHGVGGINIDGCRVASEDNPKPCVGNGFRSVNDKNAEQGYRPKSYSAEKATYKPSNLGRFPANLIHDGSDEVLACFPETGKSSGGGLHTKGKGSNNQGNAYGVYSCDTGPDTVGFGDSGSAARFFYCAKASRSERGEGNGHPTVKPLALMKYLVTLVAPPNAVVLDSYMGSGTTGVAALQLGRKFVGIERDSEYFRIAKARMEGAELPLFASADRGE